ncbi:MAG: RNA polymerase sigma factor [Phycisphaera sp.]|nr:RNA polymerase sigma factor [Phycisphaera sp.]
MSDGEAAKRRSAIVLDLFDRYHARVFAFARRSVDAGIAEDTVQEVFVRLLEHPRLEELDISISYLLRIAQNLLRRRYTRSARLRMILEKEMLPRERRRRLDGGGVYDRQPPSVVLEQLKLDEAMARLSPDERDAVRLVVCEGLSYAEAARSLGVSVTAVNNWRHRGLAKIRGLVEAQRNEVDDREYGRRVRTG